MSETSGERARLRSNLRLIASLGTVLTYHDAARSIGLGPSHVIHSLTRLLEALMAEDAEAGRPFIAALVVSRGRDGLPARGFFEAARRLGRFAGDPVGEEAAAWYAAERAMATAYYSQHP